MGKLTKDQTIRLTAFVARRWKEGETNSLTLSEEWLECEERGKKDPEVSPQQIRYRIARLRREALDKAADDVEEIAANMLQQLHSIGTADPRDLVSWDADGKVEITPAEELTPTQAAAIRDVKIERKPDGSLVVDFKTHDKAKAALGLLSFIKGHTINVKHDKQVIERLTAAGDIIGLKRISHGEDPLQVFMERVPFLNQTNAVDDDD